MQNLETLSKKTGEFLLKNKFILVTAESLTAGLISSTLAHTPGSSAWLEGGFTVYSELAKHNMLGVNFQTIEQYNITSPEVAKEMSEGALARSQLANVAVSTTGVAGPTGGSEAIPVGTVAFAWSFKMGLEVHTFTALEHFTGNRQEVREQSAWHALSQLEHYYQEMIAG